MSINVKSLFLLEKIMFSTIIEIALKEGIHHEL